MARSRRTPDDFISFDFNPRTPRGATAMPRPPRRCGTFQSTHPARGATDDGHILIHLLSLFQSTHPARRCDSKLLPKSRSLLGSICLFAQRGRRLSIQKQTRLCSIKLSFMLFGCEPAGEGVSSWTSHATKSKVRLEGRSAYSQSARSSAHSDFPGNKSGGCPVRDP